MSEKFYRKIEKETGVTTSYETKHLLDNLLQYKPTSRYTFESLINSPYLNSIDIKKESKLYKDEMSEKVKKFKEKHDATTI